MSLNWIMNNMCYPLGDDLSKADFDKLHCFPSAFSAAYVRNKVLVVFQYLHMVRNTEYVAVRCIFGQLSSVHLEGQFSFVFHSECEFVDLVSHICFLDGSWLLLLTAKWGHVGRVGLVLSLDYFQLQCREAKFISAFHSECEFGSMYRLF